MGILEDLIKRAENSCELCECENDLDIFEVSPSDGTAEQSALLCPKCKSETFIDHVTVNNGVTTYSYVCVNPRCEEYRKAFTLTGVEAEATIEGAK